MTKNTPDIWHARKDGLTVPTPHGRTASGRTLSRGDEVDMSAIVDLVRDRFGNSWAEDLSDEAQLERWHEIRYVRGIASEVDPDWFGKLVAEREVLAAADEQARKLEAHRYGRRYAVAVKDSIAAARGTDA